MPHHEDHKLKSLHEIYEENKDEYDYIMVNKEDGFDLYNLNYLKDQKAFEHFFLGITTGRKIYEFIDREKGSDVYGKMISTGHIIATLVDEHSEFFDFS